MKRKEIAILIIVALLTITLPYAFAALNAGPNLVFGGFLLNPVDGNTYLAKMVQGWEGAWRFRLPYTAEPGEGAYLFLFYLFLGHLSRWLTIPPVWMFHLSRAASTVLMVLALTAFLRRVFPSNPSAQRAAAWLAVFGSGMGWAAALAGALTADFWVAEAYPFLSAYANPHFPLGLALLLWAMSLKMDGSLTARRAALLAAVGLLESIIMPFGVVLIGGILLAAGALEWLECRRVEWWQPVGRALMFTAAGLSLGGTFLLYQFWAATTDPVLAGWNAQNLTPAPPVWDFVLSLSPALPLALFGARQAWKNINQPGRRLLLAWLVIGVALTYAPFSLQRRFMTGLYIPLATLAVIGLGGLGESAIRKWASPALVGFSLPTNLLLLMAGVVAAMSHSPEVYFSADEGRAFAWLRENTPADALVVAAPETGSLIPAYTGRRVIYGHPFETVNAEAEKQAVESFFRGELDEFESQTFLNERGAGYIFWGPEESSYGSSLGGFLQKPIFRSGGVVIYQWEGRQ